MRIPGVIRCTGKSDQLTTDGKCEYDENPHLYLALENGNPEDVVTVSDYACTMPEVKMGFSSGDQFYLKDLLYALMLESYNDAAAAIAEQIGPGVWKVLQI